MKRLPVVHILGFTLCSMLLVGFAACAQETVTEGGFRIALPNYSYAFPKDHGSHPEFKIEWWYLTGHLWNTDRSRRFGYQATFFRRGVRPQPQSASPQSTAPTLFGGDQVYLAHMAIVDEASQTFVHEERLNRNGWDAAASVDTLNVRNGNWSLSFLPRSHHPEAMRLQGSVRAEARFDLHLIPSKPKVIFGDDGVSRKGAALSAASHYITFPRLATNGSLQFQGQSFEVTGQSWMDHEISSSQLDANQEGWDWASIQLDDGRELMIYVMRQKDGGIDPYSTLNWIDASGNVTSSGPTTFEWRKTGFWTSPHSGTRYPTESSIGVDDPSTGQPLTLTLKPIAADQELQGDVGGVRYWEGACNVFDSQEKRIGHAYVELAGYDGQLTTRLH